MRRKYIAAMDRDVATLCARIREGIEGPKETSDECTIQRAWIAWKVALIYDESFGAKSFGLLALDILFSAIRDMEVEREQSEMDLSW
jgi:RNA-dependent RNA polymerase